MKFPNFSPDQYIDADSMNTGFSQVSGSIAIGLTATSFPGLVSPEVVVVSATGLVAGVSLPAPFGVLFGSGIQAQAHGTVSNSDTQNYTANFASLIPAGSGTVTAYALLSYMSIQQDPVAITGPPPGHPDFNPNFIATTAYSTNVDSLAFVATGAAPDNVTTFELFRCFLTSATVALTSGNIAFTFRRPRGPHQIMQTQQQSVSGAVFSFEKHNWVTAPGAYNLPLPQYEGVLLTITSATSGNVAVSTTDGRDSIYGLSNGYATGKSSFALLQGSSVTLASLPSTNSGIWQVLSTNGSRYQLTQDADLYFSSTGSDVTGDGTQTNPWATGQHARDFVQRTYDLAGQFTVRYHGAGNFTTSGIVINGPLVGQAGALNEQFLFSNGSVLSGNFTPFAFNGNCTTSVGADTSGTFLVACTGANNSNFSIGLGAQVVLLSGVNHGQAGIASINLAYPGGKCAVGGNFHITGTAPSWAFIGGQGQLVFPGTGSILGTIVGSPVFANGFIEVTQSGNVVIPNTNTIWVGIPGAVTPRYVITQLGMIDTNSGGIAYLPGTVAGSGVNYF